MLFTGKEKKIREELHVGVMNDPDNIKNLKKNQVRIIKQEILSENSPIMCYIDLGIPILLPILYDIPNK